MKKETSYKKADYPNVNLSSRKYQLRNRRSLERLGINVDEMNRRDRIKDKIKGTCDKLRFDMKPKEYLKVFKKCEKYKKSIGEPIDKMQKNTAENILVLKNRGLI
ncbi:MAG: hypothetical protein AABY22_16775 [Nanoarchaeota archaeon]